MTALALLTRYWREAAIGTLLIALVAMTLIDGLKISRLTLQRDAEIAAHRKTKADYRTAQAIAAAQNLSEVREIEQANAATTQEIQNDLSGRLAAARAAGIAYANRLRSGEATTCPASRASATSEGDSAAAANRASAQTLLAEDVEICGENTVKAAAWQDWYAKLK